MILYAEKGPFECYRFEPDELKEFWLSMCAVYEDKALKGDPDVPDAEKILYSALEEGPDYWKLVFNDAESAQFILLKKNGAKPSDLVGVGSVDVFDEDDFATLNAAHIISDFRGQGLSALLYDARLKYVDEETTFPHSRVAYRTDNIASRCAALRAGFEEKGTYTTRDGKLMIEAYRRRPNAPLPKPEAEP